MTVNITYVFLSSRNFLYSMFIANNITEKPSSWEDDRDKMMKIKVNSMDTMQERKHAVQRN